VTVIAFILQSCMTVVLFSAMHGIGRIIAICRLWFVSLETCGVWYSVSSLAASVSVLSDLHKIWKYISSQFFMQRVKFWQHCKFSMHLQCSSLLNFANFVFFSLMSSTSFLLILAKLEEQISLTIFMRFEFCVCEKMKLLPHN